MVGRRRLTEAWSPPAELRRIDEIGSVPGVDVAFIGPGDLATSLDHFGEPDHSEVQAARAAAAEAGILRGKVLLGGAARSVDQLRRMVERG